MRRRVGIGVLIAAGLLLALLVASMVFRSEQSLDRTFGGEIKRVIANVDVGSVSVIAEARSDVAVQRRQRYFVATADVSETTEGDTLNISSNCNFPVANCSVDYIIRAPKLTEFQIFLESGSVDAESGSGLLRAETDAGSIRLLDWDGAARLDVTIGSIIGDGLSAQSVIAATRTGAVQLGFTEPPASVDASTIFGEIAIVVPDEAYRVDVNSLAGGERVITKTDPDSPRRIKGRTVAGGIVVRRV